MKFHWNTRKQVGIFLFLLLWGLSREAVESPSVEIPKIILDTVLGNLLLWTLLEQGGVWTRRSQKVPSSFDLGIQ